MRLEKYALISLRRPNILLDERVQVKSLDLQFMYYAALVFPVKPNPHILDILLSEIQLITFILLCFDIYLSHN